MVITVTCPSCSSSFPVDSAKVPDEGVNTRCTSCGDIFRIEKPVESEPGPTVVTEEPVPPPTVPEPAAPVDEEPSGLDEVDVVPPPPLPRETADESAVEPTLAEPAPAPPVTEPAPEAPEEVDDASEPAVSGFTFGKRDPTDKARRLARVLVSDMIMYNADRHQSALEAGTLKEDFEEEIEKSWKEFVEQVGEDLAEGDGRDFWREALNDILAKGEPVF